MQQRLGTKRRWRGLGLLLLGPVAALFAACSSGVTPGADAGPRPVPDAGPSVDAAGDTAAPDASDAASAVDAADDAAGDASTSCPTPVSPGRGLVQTVATGALVGSVKSLGVACGRLLLGSGPGGGARPWESGTLRRCQLSNCATTLVTVPAFDLHAPAGFSANNDNLLAYGRSQPFSLNTGSLDTPGDVVVLGPDGVALNLGAILDPAADLAASFDHVLLRGTSLVFDRRTYHNTGNYRGVVVIRDVGGTPVMTEVAAGVQVGGVVAQATPTRVFALGDGTSTGAQLVNLIAATASPFYSGAFRRGFVRDERVGGVGWDRSTPGANTQVLCESDATCDAPSSIANASLPDAGYLGVFHDELVWSVASGGNVALLSCALATWGTAACVPATVAASAPTPDGDVQSDGASLYYVSGGEVIRVGL